MLRWVGPTPTHTGAALIGLRLSKMKRGKKRRKMMKKQRGERQ